MKMEKEFYYATRSDFVANEGKRFWESYSKCCRKPDESHFRNLCIDSQFYPNTKAHILRLTCKEYRRFGKSWKFISLYKVISSIYRVCSQAGLV